MTSRDIVQGVDAQRIAVHASQPEVELARRRRELESYLNRMIPTVLAK